MKKILTPPAGIVLLITILIAVGCGSGNKSNGSTSEEFIKDSTKVKIYLKAIIQNEEKHLEMYDSNNPKNVVVDSLYTRVVPGMKVIWKFDRQSGIKKINKIGSSKGDRNIFKKDAEKRTIGKGFKLELSEDIDGKQEKYDIEITDKDGNPWPPIDPYLKIPDE